MNNSEQYSGKPPAPTPGGLTEYTYDVAGRLETVSVDGVEVYEYGYDANGNRESVTTAGGTVTAVFDAHDRLIAHGDVELEYPLCQEV